MYIVQCTYKLAFTSFKCEMTKNPFSLYLCLLALSLARMECISVEFLSARPSCGAEGDPPLV